MSQITILNQANVPMGPFTREQVAEKLQKGEVTMGNLAFVEGLSQWTPLGDVLARVDSAAPLVKPVVPAPPVAAAPAAPIPAPGYSYAATMQPPPHLVYAGFWIRFCAYLIDGIVLTFIASGIVMVFVTILSVTIGTSAILSGHPGSPVSASTSDPATVAIVFIAEGLLWLVNFVVFWLYFAWFESCAWQASLGKKALGLRVTDMSGERISFWRATGRYFGKCISTMILYIGYIMVAFTERKQALHDMIAGTLVVRN